MLNAQDSILLTGQRIAVTGGTGFVGQHLVKALINAGARVTCLLRNASRAQFLPAQAKPLVARLDTGEGLDAFVRDQDICIHLAAVLFGLGWQDYIRDNVLAAEHLGAALHTHGQSVRRVVLVSSLAATGPCAQSPGIQDTTLPAPVSAYGWSKLMAEYALARHTGGRMVTVRPPIIYGSGDKGLLPYYKAAHKGFVVTPGLGRRFPVSAIHVHDVVQAIVRCCAPQAHGVYHCNDGAEHTLRDIGLSIAAALGRRARVIAMPLPVMGAAALCCGLVGQILMRMGQRVPSLTLDKYREAQCAGWLCAGERIRSELGFVPQVSLDAGIRESIAGYRAAGWL